MTIAKTKLEKEHDNCLELTVQLKQSEARAKKFLNVTSKLMDTESERNDLVQKARSHKVEMATMREEL